MPDLGAIGVRGLLTKRLLGVLRVVMAGAVPLYLFNRRDDVLGNPTPPSQQQPQLSTLRDIYWPVTAGERLFRIDVYYGPNSTPKPELIFKATPGVGLGSDVVVTPTGPPGVWETLTFNFTATGTGAIPVWRRVTDSVGNARANWDNVVVT